MNKFKYKKIIANTAIKTKFVQSKYIQQLTYIYYLIATNKYYIYTIKQ